MHRMLNRLHTWYLRRRAKPPIDEDDQHWNTRCGDSEAALGVLWDPRPLKGVSTTYAEGTRTMVI